MKRVGEEREIDVSAEATDDASFSLRRFLHPYRRPLSIGFGIVVLDTLFAPKSFPTARAHR